MQVPMTGGLDTSVSKVEIRISCRNLIRLDVLSESDPLVRVEQFDVNTGRWNEVGRTEWQQNQKNPNFARCIQLDYWFERVQKLRFQVFDIDRQDSVLSSGQDFVGETIVNLGDILGNKGGTLSRDIHNPSHPSRKNGVIIIRAEEVNADAQNSVVTFRFSGSHLDKKDFFGKSDPYLEIYRNNPADSQWILVHKTEIIKKTLDPTWRPFEIDASKLCQGDYDRPLLFKVWDWDSDGGHDLIGDARTTLNEMIKGKRQFPLIEPNIQRKKRGYTNSGILNVHQVDIRRVHSFLEYIAGGCQLRLAVAIDFTASNGNPVDPKSLHYRNPSGEPNEYLKAIMAVGDIVASYDQTKQFPTYGFGAKIPPTNETSHCFHVNLNPGNPECIGIENVIGAYQHCLSYVKLSGPTNFAPIIKQVATIARAAPIKQQVYWILLMITDGVISDMERTIAEIVDASDLPFSIIIVGVGDADFTDMDALDSDDRLLRTRTGKTATRDIVQFVPFRDFKHKHYSELARATLAELPRQLTDYYKAHNIAPNPAPVVPMTQAGLQIPLTQAGLHVPTGPVGQAAGPMGGGFPPAGQAPPQGQWGAPPPQSQQAGQWGAPPQQQQGQWGGQPQPQGQWGAPPSQPQGQWGQPPPQGSGYPAGPQQGGYPGGPQQGGPQQPQPTGDRQTAAGPAGYPGPGGPQQQQQPTGGYPGGPQSGYPGGQQPPQQQGGYPGGPQQGGYPGGPQQGGYPGGQAPPAAGGPPPQQGGYPGGPQQGGPQSGYPGGPQQGGPQSGYPGGQQPPPQQGGYPGGQAPPAAGGPPPQQPAGASGGYPAQPQQGAVGDVAKQGDASVAGAAVPAAGQTPAAQPGGYPSQQPPPQQQQWGGQPQQQQWAGQPQQQQWGGQPQQQQWGAPQQQWGQPQQQWGGQPQQQQWGGQPQQQQWGAPQQQQQWGGQPQQQQWGGQPQQQWGGQPQPQQQWGGQPQQQWGAPQQGVPAGQQPQQPPAAAGATAPKS